MQILNKKDTEQINILINEFIVSVHMNSKESIPAEFLKYLRELLNELTILIEKKCFGI